MKTLQNIHDQKEKTIKDVEEKYEQTLQKAWAKCEPLATEIGKLSRKANDTLKNSNIVAYEMIKLGRRAIKSSGKKNIYAYKISETGSRVITINKYGLGYIHRYGKNPEQALAIKDGSHSYQLSDISDFKELNKNTFKESMKKECPEQYDSFIKFIDIISQVTHNDENSITHNYEGITLSHEGAIRHNGQYIDATDVSDYMQIEQYAPNIKQALILIIQENEKILKHNTQLLEQTKEAFKVMLFIEKVI